MKAFSEGFLMSPSDMGWSAVGRTRPWSWATNDVDFARRIMKVMGDMGVELMGEGKALRMEVAGKEERDSCDED